MSSVPPLLRSPYPPADPIVQDPGQFHHSWMSTPSLSLWGNSCIPRPLKPWETRLIAAQQWLWPSLFLKISGASSDHVPQFALLSQLKIRGQSPVSPNVRERNFTRVDTLETTCFLCQGLLPCRPLGRGPFLPSDALHAPRKRKMKKQSKTTGLSPEKNKSLHQTPPQSFALMCSIPLISWQNLTF